MKRFRMKRKHYVVRNKKGQIKKWTSVKRSLSADKRKKAKTVKSGYGHIGDLKRRKRRTRRKRR